MNSRPKYFGKPTLGQVMVRPRWILALLLALAVGATFAFLAQWQMGTAVKLQQVELDTETVYPIDELTETQTPLTDETGARMMSLSADILEIDTYVVDERMNFGEQGVWVIGHAVREGAVQESAVKESTDAHIVVALGWAADTEQAAAFIESFEGEENLDIVGRYMPQESSELPKSGQPIDYLKTVSVGQLVNIWQPFEGEVYAGYLILANQFEGLDVIESVPPLPQETINWLNLFYAIEWAVFAGFAVFFWYRLARDAWEKEHELMALNKKAEE